jgi:hypothetical protein
MQCIFCPLFITIHLKQESSVADPDPDLDPEDPHVFGPPGSGSSSGSFYHDFLSLKNYVKVPSKSNKKKT